MNHFFEQIINALQDELQEYGGLLHLFQEQQQTLLHHDPESFLSMVEGVDEQIRRSTQKRVERENLVRETARQVGVAPESNLVSLLPYSPEPVRPLLTALIEEINDLLHQTRRRLRQNHMLLGHCLDLARQMVSLSKPELATNTYNSRGQRSAACSVYSFSEISE
jgi:flagellar biosynthesis/type III secretory pathway chaperone